MCLCIYNYNLLTLQPVAVGASFETVPGHFNEIYFYDSDIEHPEDGKLIENTYTFEYVKPHQNFSFTPPSRRMKLRLRSTPVWSEQGASPRKKRRANDGVQFLDSEARECVSESDYGEENDNIDFWDIDDPAMDPVERMEQEELLRDKLSTCDSLCESSAVVKFLNYFLTPQFCHSTFLAHNNARVSMPMFVYI